MEEECRNASRTGRRRFLKQVCGGTAAAFTATGMSGGLAAAADAPPSTPQPSQGLATIQLGPYRVTRLLSGGNPVEGYAHSTENMRRHMLEYFTPERTVEYLERVEREGINTWQFDHFPKPAQALRAVRERGSKLQFICVHHEGRAPIKKAVDEMKPIAVVHHGGVTDTRFREGKAQEVRDFVKKVKDLGLLAGVSSHNPENIKRIADEGWENDFFMTCFYNLTFTREAQQKHLGKVVVDEPFFESDRVEMTNVVLQVPKPCLAFKILAAGRLCNSQEEVERAFQYAYSRIKKTDAVIVGMYPRFEDEIRLNVGYAKKYGSIA